MKLLLSFVFLFSTVAFANQAPGRQFMSCFGAELDGVKAPILVQFFVLNSKQVEGLKIQYKKQVWVNEINKVMGQVYNDGIIVNHVIFTPRSNEDLAVLLPANFRLMKSINAFLSQEEGDQVNFTALTCSFK